ncbi:DUF1697 domain-containing protein, partial [Bacillus wiedmannii]
EIKNVFCFDVPVMLSTRDEFINIIKGCPYEADSLLVDESIHVAFLANELTEKEKDHLLKQKNETEDCFIHEKVVYLFFKNSIRNSKLMSLFQKLHTPATVRNCRTVNKLKTIVEGM